MACALTCVLTIGAALAADLVTSVDEVSNVQPGGVIEVCFYGTGDVPTTELSSNLTFLPSQVFRYDADPPTYTAVLTVPGEPELAGLFKLDAPGGWLFSVEVPSDIGGALSAPAEPRDIVKRDVSDAYDRFFCGESVADPVPRTSRIDAFYLEGGDDGDLVVSFDVPTRLGTEVFGPTDLVRYLRTGASCNDWQLAPGNPVFDASATGAGISLASNAVGASAYAGLTLFSPDVPTRYSPPGLTVVPGEIVAWNGVEFSLFATLAGWPIGSNFNGLAAPGNPGRVGDGVRIERTANPKAVRVSWEPGCSTNAGNYAVYEGQIGKWGSHAPVTCADTGNDLTEEFEPGTGDRYFLVVPLNPLGEGSYGTTSDGMERAVGSGPCVTRQVLSTCPE